MQRRGDPLLVVLSAPQGKALLEQGARACVIALPAGEHGRAMKGLRVNPVCDRLFARSRERGGDSKPPLGVVAPDPPELPEGSVQPKRLIGHIQTECVIPGRPQVVM